MLRAAGECDFYTIRTNKRKRPVRGAHLTPMCRLKLGVGDTCPNCRQQWLRMRLGIRWTRDSKVVAAAETNLELVWRACAEQGGGEWGLEARGSYCDRLRSRKGRM